MTIESIEVLKEIINDIKIDYKNSLNLKPSEIT